MRARRGARARASGDGRGSVGLLRRPLAGVDGRASWRRRSRSSRRRSTTRSTRSTSRFPTPIRSTRRTRGTALRFYAIGPWLLIPLGLVGLVLAVPARIERSAYIVWAPFVPAYAAAVALFFVAERYRLPLLVPLCAGAGAAIDLAMRAAAARRWTAVASGAVAVLTLGIAANWPLRVDEGRWLEGLRMAQQLVILGRYDEADRWARGSTTRRIRSPGAASGGRALRRWRAAARRESAAARAALSRRGAPGRPGGRACRVRARPGAAESSTARRTRSRIFAAASTPGSSCRRAATISPSRCSRPATSPAPPRSIRRINPAASDDAEAWLRLGRLAAQVAGAGRRGAVLRARGANAAGPRRRAPAVRTQPAGARQDR